MVDVSEAHEDALSAALALVDNGDKAAALKAIVNSGGISEASLKIKEQATYELGSLYATEK